MVISGSDLAKKIKDDVAKEVERCLQRYGRPPRLEMILVGSDPASATYVKGKANDAARVGFDYNVTNFHQSITQSKLLSTIRRFNNDPNVDAILVQLPLPAHIDETAIVDAIDPRKDADGFNSLNIGKLWQRLPCLLPCTPKGIIRILRAAGVKIGGKHAVVIGRSNIVGLPVSKLLLDHDATVTIAHTRTTNLPEITRQAEILIVAAGCPKFVTADMISPGAVVIDVGVNRNPENGKLCGDVDFEACKDKASVITCVPGGVGPMTKACLMENTLECYLKNMRQQFPDSTQFE